MMTDDDDDDDDDRVAYQLGNTHGMWRVTQHVKRSDKYIINVYLFETYKYINIYRV